MPALLRIARCIAAVIDPIIAQYRWKNPMSWENLRDKGRVKPIFRLLRRPYGLAVRTPPFHGGSPGSIPGRVAIFKTPIKQRFFLMQTLNC